MSVELPKVLRYSEGLKWVNTSNIVVLQEHTSRITLPVKGGAPLLPGCPHSPPKAFQRSPWKADSWLPRQGQHQAQHGYQL
ncbi:hypothetical protein AVEN_93130-1 [Araneus ventricosus]|uniref:Uncharacterized protein n=1 Tax=Araneus ventricosus TaxID=182803 RepID=A0A4Y2IH27_ARAVE|nr:hypothetical protein AVEN_93130-1 [Araneus ventricosus]